MSDKRLLPARADVAAAHLKGLVKAERYADGVAHQVRVGATSVREAPTHSSRLETQLLRGERFNVFDEANGWAWGQIVHDDYVGYVEAADLTQQIVSPTYRVSVLRTLVFPRADIKSSPPEFLSLNAKVAVESGEGRFAKLADGGYAIAAHLVPIDAKRDDWVSAAELLLNTPYLWGGRDSFGIDCSGLVQVALETAGVQALRDSDMQEAQLGLAVAEPYRRGDLVFWDGHVGIMLDADRLLHASGFHMCVVIEPLAEAVTRITPTDGPVRAVKRL